MHFVFSWFRLKIPGADNSFILYTLSRKHIFSYTCKVIRLSNRKMGWLVDCSMCRASIVCATP